MLLASDCSPLVYIRIALVRFAYAFDYWIDVITTFLPSSRHLSTMVPKIANLLEILKSSVY
jgi:hypothetical protein